MMSTNRNSKYQELEDRTAKFAEKCRNFIKKLPKIIANVEYSKQLIRSSGSQAANYIEANESLSKKDFVYRVRIARKEAKESCLWIKLCDTEDSKVLKDEQIRLLDEGVELRKIFSKMLMKSV